MAKKRIAGASISIMSKGEFTKKKCLTFEDYVKQYGDLVKKRDLSTQEAFQRMIDNRYDNYIYHQKIIAPGRIF